MGQAPEFECVKVGFLGKRAHGGKLEWQIVIFYRNSDGLFYSQFSFDFLRTIGFNYDDLHGQLRGQRIPLHHIYPSFQSNLFTIAPDPLPPHTHVKYPDFLRYKHSGREREDTVAQLVRQEALVCEVLRRNPHPNVAEFFGCQVENGKINGLCFKEYRYELRAVIKACPSIVDKERCLEGVRRGMEHLHSLGYVHNDIKPRNIMIDDFGNAIIIDFDSCRPIGAHLGPKFGTKGFCAFGTKISTVVSDYYSLQLLRKYLEDKL